MRCLLRFTESGVELFFMRPVLYIPLRFEFTLEVHKMSKSILRGDLFYADLNPVVGSEQGGIRPVLVIQNSAEDQPHRYYRCHHRQDCAGCSADATSAARQQWS